MSQGKIHVNPETGEIGTCSARTNGCPFGESFHAETREEAETLYRKHLESQKCSEVIFSTFRKSNEEIISDPKNNETVEVTKAVYLELQKLKEYEKEDRELANRLEFTPKINKEYSELLKKKSALEGKIASLDSKSKYNDPKNHTLDKNELTPLQELTELDKRYWDMDRELANGALYIDVDSFYKIRDRRDKLALELGKKTIEEVKIDRARNTLSNLDLEFENSKNISEKMNMAEHAREVSSTLGDESESSRWSERINEIKLRVLETTLDQTQKEPFSFGKLSKLRKLRKEIDSYSN